MLFRAIALSVALLIGIATIVPIATDSVEAGPKKTRKYRKKSRNWRGVKKYSKRWWQLYRAQERRKKALRKRRRAMRLRQMRLARLRAARTAKPAATASNANMPPQTKSAAMLPSGQPAHENWKPGDSTGGEVRFRLENNGASVGTASISVVGPATGETVSTGRHRYVGGVPLSALRREVINRMIRENGWVVNDYQKQVGGKAVYVVVAQSQEGSRVNSRMFYFTEADGRIYSVATNTPVDRAEQLAEESEKVIFSLQARPRPVQQASTKE